jgi:hypothetical protein
MWLGKLISSHGPHHSVERHDDDIEMGRSGIEMGE